MVHSKLNDTTQYRENPDIEPGDRNTKAAMYEMDILKRPPVPIIFVLGNGQEKGDQTARLMWYPIYLVKKNRRMAKIGLFEILQKDAITLLNGENQVDVEKFKSLPLLFAFVTHEYLKKNAITADELDAADDDTDDAFKTPGVPTPESGMPPEIEELYIKIPQDLSNTFEYHPINIPPLLEPETEGKNNGIKKRFEDLTLPTEKPNWIQRRFKNPHYSIIDTVADGNCFFDAITKAYAQIGWYTTPDKLRDLLANNATEDDFKRYKDMYDATAAAKVQAGGDIKRISGEYNMIKSRMQNTLDRTDRIQLYNTGQQLAGAHAQAKARASVVHSHAGEFAFMKGVNTLDEFKRVLKTPKYWADHWGIENLQKLLGVKVIILSDENKDDHKRQIVQCDSAPSDMGAAVFRPRFYIIVEYSGGNHYRLVGYNKKFIFQFSELPYSIKRGIYKTCRGRDKKAAGFYGLIPDFKTYYLDENARAATANDDLSLANMQGLYDDNIQLGIGISLANPLVGKELGDRVVPPDKVLSQNFLDLQADQMWRKKLSADWAKTKPDGPKDKHAYLFLLDDKTWASVEHYVQAAKYKSAEYFYMTFALESGKELSKNPGMARAAASKDGIYKKKHKDGKEETIVLRHKDIKPDANYDAAGALLAATRAKYKQNPGLARLLMLTDRAKLMNVYSNNKKPAEMAEVLMKVRAELLRERSA